MFIARNFCDVKLALSMRHLRKYGHEPFSVAVIHGGPGARGEMAPVARELCYLTGVLEPLQTAATIDGQVEELRSVLEKHGELPLVIVGFSWGAWLGFIFAVRHPAFVRKLILIGSGAYEERYAESIMQVRLSRLCEGEREEALSLLAALDSPDIEDSGSMTRFGELMFRADSYDPLPHADETLEYDPRAYQGVWEQASKLRRSGELLRLGTKIHCPVVAVHGDYDPHLAQGVKEPLTRIIRDFRFILLEECGHYPWLERNVRDRFFSILKTEIGQ